jgi:hypothetical protein
MKKLTQENSHMKYIFTLILVLVFAASGVAQVRVRTHTRQSGKTVASHQRTKPNKTQRDNYSTKGNRNPHTGKMGTRRATR